MCFFTTGRTAVTSTSHNVTNTLALDFGVRCGWSRSLADVIDSGTEVFDREAGVGARFAKFNDFLCEKTLDNGSPRVSKVEMIVYEQPLGRFATSQAQVYLTVGFATRVQEHCYRHDMTFHAIPIMTLKKWTTGDGRADKAAMIKAVNERWGQSIPASEDDEADAFALLKYAQENRN